jgi:hypothetical protein
MTSSRGPIFSDFDDFWAKIEENWAKLGKKSPKS